MKCCQFISVSISNWQFRERGMCNTKYGLI